MIVVFLLLLLINIICTPHQKIMFSSHSFHSVSDADFGRESPTRRAALSVRSDLLILSPVYLSAKCCWNGVVFIEVDIPTNRRKETCVGKKKETKDTIPQTVSIHLNMFVNHSFPASYSHYHTV